jgi:hypothetical protein
MAFRGTISEGVCNCDRHRKSLGDHGVDSSSESRHSCQQPRVLWPLSLFQFVTPKVSHMTNSKVSMIGLLVCLGVKTSINPVKKMRRHL